MGDGKSSAFLIHMPVLDSLTMTASCRYPGLPGQFHCNQHPCAGWQGNILFTPFDTWLTQPSSLVGNFNVVAMDHTCQNCSSINYTKLGLYYAWYETDARKYTQNHSLMARVPYAKIVLVDNINKATGNFCSRVHNYSQALIECTLLLLKAEYLSFK